MQNSERRSGKYAVLEVRVPGDMPRRAGVLLVDHLDRIHFKLSERLFSADLDVIEFWSTMADQIVEFEQSMGGHGALTFIEERASNFLSLERIEDCGFRDPEVEVDRLFRTLVLDPEDKRGDRYTELGIERFRKDQIRSVLQNLPTSPGIAMRAINALKKRDGDLSEVESIVVRDPAIAAQLIRLANIGKYWKGGTVRSIRQALIQIGIDGALTFIFALAMRPLFSSPSLRRLWNDAIASSHLLVQLGALCVDQDPEELTLLGLIFNVGQIVFAGLPEYEIRSQKLQVLGFCATEIEQILCGQTHADVGAELFADWGFAPDMVQAIRFHHNPSYASESKSSALLFMVESWMGSSPVCSLDEYLYSSRLLGISANDLSSLNTNVSTEMKFLRF